MIGRLASVTVAIGCMLMNVACGSNDGGSGGSGAAGVGGTGATGGSAAVGGQGGSAAAGGQGGSAGGGCGATSCPGCCFNGVCQPGNTVAACGHSGQQCAQCASFELCPANECTIDPESRWDVIAVSSECDTTKLDGSGWDVGGGAPDLRACFEMPQGTPVACTTEATDSFSPSWNQTIGTAVQASVLQSDAFAVQLHDVDLSANDWAGGLTQFSSAVFEAGGVADADTGQGCRLTLAVMPK